MNFQALQQIVKLFIVFFACTLQPTGWGSVQAEMLLVQEEQQAASYLYMSGDRRDPFQSILGPAQSTPLETSKPVEVHLPSASWKILGIMSGAKGTQAVLRNASGHRYIVSPGDIVGAENVRVVQLTQSSVTLEAFTSEVSQHTRLAPQIIELTFGQ